MISFYFVFVTILLWKKAVYRSNLQHLAFSDSCIIKWTSQHHEKWEGVPLEE